MRITYDGEVNAAYIYLRDVIEPGGVKMTYCCDRQKVDAEINLDFDTKGRLVGIEVLDASAKLPPELLNVAEIIG